nr:aminopeptidase N [Nocardioides luti]
MTLVEARARAAQLSDVSYAVELDLTDEGSFRCRTTVRFASSGPTTFLELARAEDLVVRVNGSAVEPSYASDRIALEGLLERNEVVVEARLPYVSDGDGMHAMTDPADGERYVSAYCGMDIAHRVFACFDQNDLKAPVSLTVTADPAWTVLANGLLTSVSDDGATRTFATTPPIPVALFVACAGPWHSVTWEHAALPFGWHARRSQAAELDRDAAELRTTTNDCFDHFAVLFEEPYAFDSYDQVFVPGLNWGAMELPGCVLWADELLPRGVITDGERTDRATVVAHEMAHMWFGDLVTMTWWEDTWLQESFADYMGYRVAEDGAGFAGTWVSHEASRKPGAYEADERRSTHPVAPEAEEIVDVATAMTNFDAISYSKGNSVLRQLVTWLGDEAFLAGVNRYLARHRFGNATLRDFVAALDESSDRDVHGWVDVWLRASGFDTLRVTLDGDVPVLAREGRRPHRLRVTAYDDELVERDSRMVDLGDEPVRLDDWAGLVVVPHAQGESFARLRLDERSWSAVAGGLHRIDDALTRAVLWSAALDLAHTRELSPDDFLALVATNLPHETNATIVGSVLRRVHRGLLVRRVPADRTATAVDTLAAACDAGLAAGPDAELTTAFTRGLAATSRDADRLRGWLADGRADSDVDLDPALRWTVVHRLAEIGELDEAEIAAEEAHDTSASGAQAAATARAARPTDGAKAAAWAAMTAPDVSNRMFSALAQGLWSPEQAGLLAPYVQRYLAEGPALAARGQAFSLVIGWSFPTVAFDAEQVAALRHTLDTAEVPTVLRRSWEDRYDDLS